MSNDTRPEIRFPGFTEDWEERKLNELAEFNPKSDLPERFEYVDLESVVGTELVGHRTENRYSAPSRAQRLAKKNDVFYQTVRPYQKNNYLFDLPYDNYVFSTGYAQMRPIGNGYFLLTLIQEEKFVNRVLERSTGTSYPAINSNDLAKLPVKVPADIQEQQKVGTFFKQIDNAITLHQRKLDLLKETKKGFLQKMFPKNGAKVPEIRFPGFTEDWEQRKLGEVVERVTRKNKKLESIRPLTISAQEGLIDQNEFFNKTVASRDVSGYYLVKKGEFAYNKSYSNGYPWGAVKRLNQYDMGVLSTLYIVFKPKKIDSDFLEKYYDTTYWYKEVSKHAAEGARNHGLLNIAASDFFETEIVMPLKIEEQQKIGAFFKQLDDTIALQQRKLDLLKEMKKGFLQKMFV